MDNDRRKEKIKACIAIAIIIIAILIVGMFSLKYSVEGDKNMPFKLAKITIVSTAEGLENEGTSEKWNLNLFQNNDIYFSIEKIENINDDVIKSIAIKNIQITKTPTKGEIKAYMPNSSDGRLFSYEAQYIIQENSLTYKGAKQTNSKNLEIGNQGGTAIMRFCNTGLGSYISNDDNEIKHDGTLLSKIGLKNEELNFEVNFDFVINLKDVSYSSNITLQMPCSENLMEEGTCSKEITDGFIFTRVNN